MTTNGLPVISAPASTTVNQGLSTAVGGVSLSETGTTSGESFSIQLTDTNGLLSASNAGGATVSGSGSKTLTIAGSLSQVNTALGTLADTDSVSTTDDIHLTASDGFGNAATAKDVSVTVSTLALSIAAPTSEVFGVGKNGAVTGVSLAEPGAISGETFSTTVSDTTGLLSVTGSGSAVVTGSGTASVMVSGSLTDVNNTLSSLHDQENTAVSDTITVAASDSLSNTATPKTISVTTNGLPVISAPASATVNQGVSTAVSPVSLSETGTTTGENFSVTLSDGAGLLLGEQWRRGDGRRQRHQDPGRSPAPCPR